MDANACLNSVEVTLVGSLCIVETVPESENAPASHCNREAGATASSGIGGADALPGVARLGRRRELGISGLDGDLPRIRKETSAGTSLLELAGSVGGFAWFLSGGHLCVPLAPGGWLQAPPLKAGAGPHLGHGSKKYL